MNVFSTSIQKFDDFPARIEGARPFWEYLATDCRRLRLGALDAKANDPQLQTKVGLEAVYVGFDTTTNVKAKKNRAKRESPVGVLDDEVPITAFQTVAQHHQVVLLGRPGSGKSTFFHHLAFRLARHGCEPSQNWLAPFALALLNTEQQNAFIDSWLSAHREHCGMDRAIANGTATRLKAALILKT